MTNKTKATHTAQYPMVSDSGKTCVVNLLVVEKDGAFTPLRDLPENQTKYPALGMASNNAYNYKNRKAMLALCSPNMYEGV